mmetsp:Transcript_6006/g.13826  ORF Transcript_6006/g.13826 Transcript_6006/m.13826 type:complete len:218 (-) Transcript_6006:200-853(-)
MAKPQSLPKGEKEKEFSRMMRAHKQQGTSVWEDSRGRGKGSGFRSLKKNSMSMQGASGDSPSHRSQSQMQMHHREPSYGVPEESSSSRSASVLPSLSRSLGVNRRWVDDERAWKGVTRAECGRVFGGEMVSHGLGVTLARQEHLVAAAQKRARNLEVVAHLMQVYPDGLPLQKPQEQHKGSADVDFLPFIGSSAGQRSPAKARMGPGYMRVESQEPT